jgi:hypothetical protein
MTEDKYNLYYSSDKQRAPEGFKFNGVKKQDEAAIIQSLYTNAKKV